MQPTRTLTFTVLFFLILCVPNVVLAANSVTDADGRIWCVRTEMSPFPVSGQEIYLYEEGGAFGDFLTMDKTIDASPHVFQAGIGIIGIVWSRENMSTGRMEICTTTFDPTSGLWVHPFAILTNPQTNIDHTEPRMEISPSGKAHLVYVATIVEDGLTTSSLVYCIKADGVWSEPSTISQSDEMVAAPELYLGVSENGYPLVLVYLSSPQSIGIALFGQSGYDQTIRTLEKDGSDPTPWDILSTHRLPINIR